MPCNGGHMEPNDREIEVSKILCFLEELEELKTGKAIKEEERKRNFKGYHPDVYNKCISQKELDEVADKLCTIIKNYDPVDIARFSLELQIWWRDHQAADAVREEEEKELKERKKIRHQAFAKLTKKEKEVLGLTYLEDE